MLRCRAICDEPTVRRIEHYILAGEGYVEKITFMHQKRKWPDHYTCPSKIIKRNDTQANIVRAAAKAMRADDEAAIR